jgi:hypothetical protein
MGKDRRHTIEAKCKQGIENWDDAPINMQKKWNRRNFFKQYRKDLVELRDKLFLKSYKIEE